MTKSETPITPGAAVVRTGATLPGVVLALASDDDQGFHTGLALVRWADETTDWNSTDRLEVTA